MNIRLKPLFAGDYRDLEPEGPLLPIGCGDAPFNSYPEALRAKLAERHACLFADGDALYVVDLHSPTGTTCNGAPVTEDPCLLAAGDVLCFGGTLCFKVCFDRDEGAGTLLQELPAPPLLLLSPLSDAVGPGPIAVSEYPFLVSKSSGHFAAYRQRFARELSFVSRRHAHVFQRGAELFIEDLGSTNGTLVNGRRLGSTAQRLDADDTLQFGHELFSFGVQIETSAAVNAATGRRAIPEGTILVAAAGSFLDIYCDAPDREADTANAAAAEPGGRTSGSRWQWWGALGRGARERWRNLPLGRELRLLLVLLPLLLLFAGVGAWLLRDDRADQAAALLQQHKPGQALRVAQEYLTEHPGDTAVQNLARRALAGYLLPEWIELVTRRDYDAAAARLAEVGTMVPGQAGEERLSLLAWVVELRRYMDARDAQAPVQLREGQHPLAALLAFWDAGSDQNLRLLEELARELPAFESIRITTLSQLRALKSEASVVLAAMDELKREVFQPLKGSRGALALAALDQFAKDYPRVRGVDAWRRDVSTYLGLQEARARGDLESYLRERQQLRFSTDYFRQRADLELPSDSELQTMVDHYALADSQWREGSFDDAIRLLRDLAQGEWGAEAAAQLPRREQLLADFIHLPELYRTPDYQTALLAFYTRLDPVADRFMFEVLQSDFANQREFAAQRAAQLLAEGEQSWLDYQQRGGISGAQRLEARISEGYRQQAASLARACAQLRQAQQVFSLLGGEAPAPVVELNAVVVAEAERQRQAITDLGAVLGPETVREKTRLLPARGEEQP
ncbi:MAG: FHA domain-containing protein [Parahaliea sp.]